MRYVPRSLGDLHSVLNRRLPDEMESASDPEVITHAEQQLNGSAVEVWEGARIVIRLQPQDK